MWIFGYGSLIWDNWEQSFGCVRKEEANLQSCRRDFNKASTFRWGTRSAPGPTLGIEPDANACCIGLAFEFSDARSDEILAYLKKREGNDFILETGTVYLRDGTYITARIPTNNRRAATYVGHKTTAERAAMARVASGKAGKCIDYVRNIREELRHRGIDDPNVEEFWRVLCAVG
jgi:cation transport protein ChaC